MLDIETYSNHLPAYVDSARLAVRLSPLIPNPLSVFFSGFTYERFFVKDFMRGEAKEPDFIGDLV